MKKIILILVLLPILSFSQCDEDFQAVGLSYTYSSLSPKGLTLQITHIPQRTKLGASIGLTSRIIKGVVNKDTMNIFDGDIFMEMSYKILSIDYQYSVHPGVGILMNLNKGASGYIGVRFDKPLGNSALFVHPKWVFSGYFIGQLGINLRL